MLATSLLEAQAVIIKAISAIIMCVLMVNLLVVLNLCVASSVPTQRRVNGHLCDEVLDKVAPMSSISLPAWGQGGQNTQGS